MSRQVSPSTDRGYGLQRVTRVWRVARATIYRIATEQMQSSAESPGRRARGRTRTWRGRSGSFCRPARSTAKGTASSGHDCASPASAPAGAVSCG